MGYIYATHKKIVEEYGDTTTETIEKVKMYLDGEIESYDQWQNGQIYGYTILEKTKCECCSHIETDSKESVGGFYGDDVDTNGMKEHVGEEFKELFDKVA